jgi:hypothetical protein
MSILWRKESEYRYRLDDTWTADKDWSTGQWYASRDGKACLCNFAKVEDAFAEAERLREADKLYKKQD